MKHIEFLHVECENYCGYIEPAELDFKSGKVTMIIGKNGVGKSTLFSIIPFTLYGMTQTGLRGENAINRKTKKNCHTQVIFKINDDEYICDRYLKYTKMGSTKVMLAKNGKVYKSGNNEVVAEIERLIMPRQLFFNTVLFGQKVSTFFTDLTDAEQKNIFRKILNLEIYVQYQKEASEKIKESENSIVEILHNIDTIEKMTTQYQNQIEELEKQKTLAEQRKKDKLEELKTTLKEKISDIKKINDIIKDFNESEKEEKLKTQNKLIQSIEEQIKILTEKANGFFNLINEKKKNIKSDIKHKSESTLQSFRQEVNDKQKEINSKASIQIKKINDTIKSIQKEITELSIESGGMTTYKKQAEEFLNKYMGMINSSSDAACPLCMRPLGSENLPKLVEECDQIKVKLIEVNKSIEEVNNKMKELRASIKSLEENISNIENQQEKSCNLLDQEVEKLKNELLSKMNIEIAKMEESANNKIKKGKDKLKAQEQELNDKLVEESRLKEELEESIKVINDLKTNKNIILEEIKSIQKLSDEIENTPIDTSMIESNKEKIQELNNKLIEHAKEVEQTEKIINMYNFWKVGFSSSGIPSMLIDEAIPFMNKRVNEYLDIISNGRYVVSFDTLQETKSGEFRDKFNIRFYDNVTHADGRELLSGGQTKIVDIATILTLSDLQEYLQGVSINIMLFDEIFDALDEDNIQNVSNMLRQLSKDKNINIISHFHIDQIEADEILQL